MVKFNPDTDIPDLTGKVIVVTGGTDGLGKESVLQYSKHNAAHIYLAARSKTKADACIQEIKTKSPNACPITFLELDLLSFDSIKNAARTFLAASSRLDILMTNAGYVGRKGTTKDGYEVTFGINHIGHALFTKLLLPTLLKTAQDHPDSTVRLVVLGSDAEGLAPKNYYLLEPSEIKSDLGNINVMTRYGQSKIANAHYTQELARRYPEAEHKVKFSCVHPGAVSTNLGNNLLENWPTVMKVVRTVIGAVIGMVSVEEGAKNQLWASVSPDVVHGEFYHPVGLTGKGSARIRDQEKAKILWDWTEKELEGHV